MALYSTVYFSHYAPILTKTICSKYYFMFISTLYMKQLEFRKGKQYSQVHKGP